MKYIPPTTPKELQDFCKLDQHIDGEIWESVYFNNDENFYISNYGRLYNTETNKFRKCTIIQDRKSDINSIMYIDYSIKDRVKKVINFTICDMMLQIFRPFISKTHVNPIPIDGNMFNLHLDNIKYVPNAYHDGNVEEKWKYIYLDGEESCYFIHIDGTIGNGDTGDLMRHNLFEAKSLVSIRHNDKNYCNTRARWMAETFIPNPNNLKLASLIDKSNTVPSLSNIYWTNRRKN